MTNWLSIALTPFSLKHIEYYLRYAVIPVTVTGVYLGLVADWTAGFYSVGEFFSHNLERDAVFFIAYCYFTLNWVAYVARYTGKYEGKRQKISPFILTMGFFLCVILAGMKQLQPLERVFVEEFLTGNYDVIWPLFHKFVGSWILLVLLYVFGTGKMGLTIGPFAKRLAIITIVIFCVFDLLGSGIVWGISWAIAQMGYLDPFRTFQSILYAILHVSMIGVWLPVLNQIQKTEME